MRRAMMSPKMHLAAGLIGAICIVAPSPGRRERYTGTIDKFGVDMGYTAAAVIVWGVIAPTANLGPGSLAGNYAGASAGAAVGAGLGANALIGGSNQQIALQPLSIEGQTGLTLRQGLRQSSCVIAGSAIAGARSWMNDLSEGRVSS